MTILVWLLAAFAFAVVGVADREPIAFVAAVVCLAVLTLVREMREIEAERRSAVLEELHAALRQGEAR